MWQYRFIRLENHYGLQFALDQIAEAGGEVISCHPERMLTSVCDSPSAWFIVAKFRKESDGQ